MGTVVSIPYLDGPIAAASEGEGLLVAVSTCIDHFRVASIHLVVYLLVLYTVELDVPVHRTSHQHFIVLGKSHRRNRFSESFNCIYTIPSATLNLNVPESDN